MPSDIVETARKYLKVPFRHQGRSTNCLDCVGLVVCVARDLGRFPPDFDYRNYNRMPNPKVMMAKLKQYLDIIPVKEAKEGDVFYMLNTYAPQHVAIKTDLGVIHATQSCGMVVEHSMDDILRSKIICAFRLREKNWWRS